MMASVKSTLITVSLSVIILSIGQLECAQTKEISLVQVNDGNWSQILTGEWMVEFYAPWCSSCRLLDSVWEELSSKSGDLGIHVGKIDISNSLGLTGRFLITELPTFYHVKEGVFRQYKGLRTAEEFLSYTQEKKWEHVKPVSGYLSPSSNLMNFVSKFYKITVQIREAMHIMMELYGIPVWASFSLFAFAAMISGIIVAMAVCHLIFWFCSSKTNNDDDVSVIQLDKTLKVQNPSEIRKGQPQPSSDGGSERNCKPGDDSTPNTASSTLLTDEDQNPTTDDEDDF